VIDEMFEANEKEKAKQKEIMMRVDSLEKAVMARDKEPVEQKTLTDNLIIQIEKLRSDFAKKISDLTAAQKDINSLQRNLKDKDTIIKKLKSAGSELKRALSTAKEKVK
jgi:chromosome segregation ATPase